VLTHPYQVSGKMILEEETFKAYGYYLRDLKHKSGKRILATCDECGIVRETSKNSYHSLCNSCVQKSVPLCHSGHAKTNGNRDYWQALITEMLKPLEAWE
jgi:hypothetical protein